MRFGNSSDYLGMESNLRARHRRTPLLARLFTLWLRGSRARPELVRRARDSPPHPTVQSPFVPRSRAPAAGRLREFGEAVRPTCTPGSEDRATDVPVRARTRGAE